MLAGEANDLRTLLQTHDDSPGSLRLHNLFGLDRGLIAHLREGCALIFPHGGKAVLSAMRTALTRHGWAEAHDLDALQFFPEARSLVEARALHALTHAASADAVELLLRQHALWSMPRAASDPARDAMLCRLLVPPLVVAVGAPNIGKSTLLNLLARRSVSVVADEPGTTRDHVGATLDLDGLTVRWFDTPGLRDTADRDESSAITRALRVVDNADLVLLCGDPLSASPEVAGRRPALRVLLREDLLKGERRWRADIAVCRDDPAALTRLATRIRETLLPRSLVAATVPWKFWN
jgi:hypothetical protein